MRGIRVRGALLTISLGAAGFVLGGRLWSLSHDQTARAEPRLTLADASRPSPSAPVPPAAAREPEGSGNLPLGADGGERPDLPSRNCRFREALLLIQKDLKWSAGGNGSCPER